MKLAARIAAGALSVSAAGGAAWVGYEGFSSKPIIPVSGDRPTIGHGSTFYSDGRAVTMADPPITRAQALELALGELDGTYGACVRKSLGDHALMSQNEFDIAADFTGQYGCSTWNTSTMKTAYLMGQYEQACNAYLQYRLFHTRQPQTGPGWTKLADGRYRFDCSTPGNKVCRGVWERSVKRYNQCIG